EYLSIREAHVGRALSASLRHPPLEERWQLVLRSVFPCQSRLPHRGFNSPPLLNPLLQGRSQPLSPAPLLAVLHRPVPGSLCGRAHHARGLPGSCPRCEAFPRRPTDGFVTLSAGDRKSTRLNSSHVATSYAVFCVKKKQQRAAEGHARRRVRGALPPEVIEGVAVVEERGDAEIPEQIAYHFDRAVELVLAADLYDA